MKYNKLFPNILSAFVSIILFLFLIVHVYSQTSDDKNAAVQDTTIRKLRVKAESYHIYALPSYKLNALQQELEYAVEQWKRYFGDRPPTLALVVFQTEDEYATTNFDFSRLREQGMAVMHWALKGGSEGQNTLSHEACHSYFVEWIDQRRKVLDVPEIESELHYGAEAVPDWFDEAVAMLCESSSLKAKRRYSQFSEKYNNGYLIQLSRLIKMTDPRLAGTIKLLQQKKAARKASGDTTKRMVFKVPKGGLEISGDQSDQEAWYPQIFVFTEWLMNRAGRDIIPKIANAYASRKSFKTVLKAEPNLPNSIAELEKQWQKYLEQR